MASNIEQNLSKILSSRYGKDVRQAIHDGIHQCYEDGKAGSTDLVAREQIANLVSENNPTDGNSELQDIRVGYDGHVYTSAGDAVRTQVTSISDKVLDLYGDVWNTSTEQKTLTYDDLVWENGYIDKDGILTKHAAYETSGLLVVKEGYNIQYDSLRSPADYYYIISCYDDKKAFMKSESKKGTGSIESGTFVVPKGVVYVRFTIYNYAGNISLQTIDMPYTLVTFCTKPIEEKIDGIENDQIEQDRRIGELEKNLTSFDYVVGFDQYAITDGELPSSDGNTISYADGQITDYIETDNIHSVYVNLRMTRFPLEKLAVPVACYGSDKHIILEKSIIALDGNYGDTITVTGTVEIDETIKYIRLGRRKSLADESVIEINKYRSLSEDYAITKEKITAIDAKLDSIWKGRKWYAFGTSLTDDKYKDINNDPTGKYPQLLNEYMKAELVNCGQGGGSITSYNNLILNKINSTDFSDADLITLEGFPNDYSMPVGDFLDTTPDTLSGAIYTAVTTFYSKAPKATVVLITASQGQLNEEGDAGYPVDFSDGKQLTFNEMTIKMGRYLGCHVIDAGGKSQINNFHPEYLVDHIHHSWAGGQQYADTIWEELKNIHPNKSNKYFSRS